MKTFHPKSDTGKLNKTAKVNTIHDSSEPDVINSIITDELGLDKIMLLCNGKKITALMDSGATVNIVSAKIVREQLDAIFHVIVIICPHHKLTNAAIFIDRQRSRQKRELVTLTTVLHPQ